MERPVIQPGERKVLIGLCLDCPEALSLGGVDFRRLAGHAARLQVESYLLEALAPHHRRLCPEAASWLGEMRRNVFAVAVDNLRRDEELREGLARLDTAGVPFILLKGSGLRAERPGLAGRFQCDVDVLLRREDLERAEEILAGLGFAVDESYLDRASMLREHFHLGYQRQGATVELHWDIDVESPAGFTERLWERSRRIELDGVSFRVLAPEHQLLVACLHLSRHAFCGGLRWLADLKLLLPAPPEVRERLVEEARGWPPRAVWCPLWLLALQGVPGSEAFLDTLDAGPAERRLLQSLLPALLLEEPWLGLPAWRGAKALHAWLFSDRSLFSLLPEAWGEGIWMRWAQSRPNGPGEPSPLPASNMIARK
ncbi:MAG TPA: nucleotidyltransferase family protein [Thermoanaerobaculia bacterium]|nr:nucleotidyltransferase family protein [Thermoanaerobaculia bacterium]